MTAVLAGLQRQGKSIPRRRDRLLGRISVLGADGVSAQVTWRRDRNEDSAAAGKLFDSLCRKGYHAFAVSGAACSRRIDAFSASLGEVILTPGCAGGWEDCDGAAWQASVSDMKALIGSLLAHLSGRGGAARPGAQRPAWQMRRTQRQALCVLLGMLSDAQRQSLRQSGCFHVRGGASGCVYRIRAAGEANIDQLAADGSVQYRLHVEAACSLPLHAALAVQALHLQDADSEHAYLSGARVLPALD